MAIDHRPAWVADAVFYQIFPDRFARSERLPKPSNLEPWDVAPSVHGYKGGDLYGVVEHLDWLTDLGVNALYFNPIFQSASNHRYHTHDYDHVDPLLGGNAALDELLDAAHERGMRVVLDGVFNHCSRGFFQFNDILENGQGSPWLDWFHVHESRPNAYDHSRAPGYDAWWGLHALPKFNTDNAQVREFLMQVGEQWVRRGIDGWRLDVPEEITTPGFWEEFRERVRAVDPDAYIVGEIWRAAPDWIGEQPRFDGVMNYPLGEAILRFVAGERIDAEVVEPINLTLTPALDAAGYAMAIDGLLGVYPEAAHRANLNVLDSHDTPRVLSMVGEDRDSVALAVTLLMTFTGAPCVYYGDEIGMSGHHDPFSRGAFPWDFPHEWHEGTLETYRSLIALRHATPALRYGDYRHVLTEGPVYAFERRFEGDRVLVVVNTADQPVHPWVGLEGTAATRIHGDGEAALGGGILRLAVPARRAVVFRIE
ncbi:MAG TPA: glycoside hydrolase family 13 protein [Acidimicrobiia bacterium]|nr:glycoside hydrolase family 13 protein [Acidimicrobiia bacterium]